MLCGGASYALIHHKADWKYFRCRSCGLVALSPRPSHDALLASYDTYLPAAPGEIECWSRMIAPVAEYAAALIERRRRVPGRRLLDIGCGYGFFLKKMAEGGWQVEGIEVSKPGREYARSKLGLHIHARPVESMAFPENRFDVATLFYVIEHVYDPQRLLKEVHRILNPGGMLLLRWPHSTPVVKVMGPLSKRYDVYHTPYHLYDFNPKTIKQLLLQTGFREVESMIGGHTLPRSGLKLWSSIFFGRLAEWVYRRSSGRLLLPGVSKTTIAFK